MKAKAKPETPVKCGGNGVSVRPPSDAWGLILVLLLFGVGVIGVARTPPHNQATQPVAGWPVALALGSLLFVPAALLTVYLFRARVTATGNGLKTRGLLGEWETPWNDIADFYTLPLPYRQSKEQFHLLRDARVFDRNGRMVAAFYSQAKQAEALRTVIAERATNAKMRTWHVKGARPFDRLPRVFTYATRENRTNAITFAILRFAALAFFSGLSVYSIYRSLARHDFGWWTLGAAGTMLLLGGVYTTLLAIATNGQKAAVRADERFIVDTDGFTFCAPNRFERVLWKNVTGYGYAPRKPKEGAFSLSYFPPCRIETASQGAFHFTALIGDVMVLREIVRVNAVYANQTDWPTPPPVPDEPLGDARLQWSSGVEGVGERVFHCRTRSNRAFLWLAALPSGAALLIAVFAQFGLTRENADSKIAYAVSAFLALLFAWAVWRYYAAQIRVGEAGITQTTPWGQTHIPWADVQSVSIKSSDPFGAKIVGANGRVIRWTPGFLAGEAELRALLAERVCINK